MTDHLARFLYSRSWYAPNAKPGKQVKYGAFLPNMGAVSMVQILEKFSDPDLIELEKLHGRPDKDHCHGYGKISGSEVSRVKELELRNDENWDGLHVDIIGWPEDDLDQKDLARQLAEVCSLNLFPEFS